MPDICKSPLCNSKGDNICSNTRFCPTTNKQDGFKSKTHIETEKSISKFLESKSIETHVKMAVSIMFLSAKVKI